MNPWFTLTLTDGAEVSNWTVPEWAFWAAVAVLVFPTLLTWGVRGYFRWRWARARLARGKALDKLAAVWGYQRFAKGVGYRDRLIMETDQDLRARIRKGQHFP